MGATSTDQVRNVVLVGHGGAGKTSLAEAMLFLSGATSRLGSVDEGHSNLDYDPEEQRRQYTMNLAIHYWRRGEISDTMRKWVESCMHGPLYYHMIWNKDRAVRMVRQAAQDVSSPGLTGRPHCYVISPAFKEVHDILKQE